MLKDVLGETRATVVEEEFRHFFETCKILGWKDMRSWSEFFAVLKLPQWNLKHLEQRITTNLLHYRSNYLAICIIIFSLQIIFAPLVLLSLILVLACALYMLVVTHNSPLVIGDVTINVKGKRVITIGVSVIFLILSGALEQLLWSSLYCIVVCTLHAIFRPRSVTSKTNKVYEELKINGFSSWFSTASPGLSASGSGVSLDVDPEDPLQQSPVGVSKDRGSDNVRKRGQR